MVKYTYLKQLMEKSSIEFLKDKSLFSIGRINGSRNQWRNPERNLWKNLAKNTWWNSRRNPWWKLRRHLKKKKKSGTISKRISSEINEKIPGVIPEKKIKGNSWKNLERNYCRNFWKIWGISWRNLKRMFEKFRNSGIIFEKFWDES